MLPSPHIRALTGDLPPDTCAACGLHRVFHYDTSSLILLGCIAAQHRVEEGYIIHDGKMRLEDECCEHCGCFDCPDDFERAYPGKQSAMVEQAMEYWT